MYDIEVDNIHDNDVRNAYYIMIYDKFGNADGTCVCETFCVYIKMHN